MRLPKAYRSPLYWAVSIAGMIGVIMPSLLAFSSYKDRSEGSRVALIVAGMPSDDELTVDTAPWSILQSMTGLAVQATGDLALPASVNQFYLRQFDRKSSLVSNFARSVREVSERAETPFCPVLASSFGPIHEALRDDLRSMGIWYEVSPPFYAADSEHPCDSAAALHAFSRDLGFLASADQSRYPEGITHAAELAENALEALAGSNIKRESLNHAREYLAKERSEARRWHLIAFFAAFVAMIAFSRGQKVLEAGVVTMALKKRRLARLRSSIAHQHSVSANTASSAL
jgi:hypothetical protein